MEILAIMTCILLYPFKSVKLDLPKDKNGHPDILCVHGYMHNETGWKLFRKRLKKMGAGSVNTVSYPSLTKDIPANSLKIKQRIDLFKEKTGRQIHVLIGHSLGGLVSLEYALEYAPKDQITYVITLGSPLHGTQLAKALGVGPSVVQIRENSDYIRSLHARLLQANHLRILTLASSIDRMILPRHSALLPEIPYAEGEEFPALGHLGFIFSTRILKKIASFLRQQHLLEN